MNNNDLRFFNICKEVSKLSDFKGTHIGAVVVYKKTIISTGFNSCKTSPLQHRYNRYRNFDVDAAVSKQHAETHALSHLIGKEIDWSKVSIYTYRELKNGKKGCSKPCTACSKLIHDLGIKTIYYINGEGNYIKERILN